MLIVFHANAVRLIFVQLKQADHFFLIEQAKLPNPELQTTLQAGHYSKCNSMGTLSNDSGRERKRVVPCCACGRKLSRSLFYTHTLPVKTQISV